MRRSRRLDDLSVYQGLLNRTSRVATAHTYGGVRDERHYGNECTLRARKTITREREITDTVSKMQGDFRKESKNSKMAVIKKTPNVNSI